MKPLLPMLFLVLLGSCRKSEPHRTQARPAAPAPPSDTPIADKIVQSEKDLSWLAGTWQQEEKQHWILFNPPADVAELSGKPAVVVRRGKLVVLSNSAINAVFPDASVVFEVSPDHAELVSAEPRAHYRRGSPP